MASITSIGPSKRRPGLGSERRRHRAAVQLLPLAMLGDPGATGDPHQGAPFNGETGTGTTCWEPIGQENDRKTIGKWWLNGGLMGFDGMIPSVIMTNIAKMAIDNGFSH